MKTLRFVVTLPSYEWEDNKEMNNWIPDSELTIYHDPLHEFTTTLSGFIGIDRLLETIIIFSPYEIEYCDAFDFLTTQN